jgi:hypothetical protein
MDRDSQHALSDRATALGENLQDMLIKLANSKTVDDLEKISADFQVLSDDFGTLAEDVGTALGDPPAEFPDAQPRSPPAAEA